MLHTTQAQFTKFGTGFVAEWDDLVLGLSGLIYSAFFRKTLTKEVMLEVVKNAVSLASVAKFM